MTTQASEIYHHHILQCWSTQKDYWPIEVVRAEGCWIHTKEGRRIFDLRSAHECINLGFNHPEIIQAITDQMAKVSYVTDDFATDITAQLAQKIVSLCPGTDKKKVWFGQSGAAAVEAALKVARMVGYSRVMSPSSEQETANSEQEGSAYYPYPYKIISRYRSWHGSTMGALSVSGDPRRWFSEPIVMPGVVHAPETYPYQSVFDQDPEGLKAADYLIHMIEMEGGADFVAAVLLEAVVGSNGIIPTPKPYMQKVAQYCKAKNILLIIDETMTGMGRTGSFLAIEEYGIEPDILIMGKALGAYIPNSCIVLSEEVASFFDDHVFGHGQSYSGHALAAAASLASIRVLEREILPELETKSAYLKQGLESLSSKFKHVGELRGKGMMWTMELVKDPITRTNFRSFNQKYQETPIKDLSRFLLEECDVYTPTDKFGLWIVPPLIVSFAEIDWLITQLEKGLVYFHEELV